MRTALAQVFDVSRYWLWQQVASPSLAQLLLEDGNDLAESQLVELVEYGTLRIVNAEEWADVERAVDAAFADLHAAEADGEDLAAEADRDSREADADGHGGGGAREGRLWGDGHDESDPSLAEVDGGDDPWADESARDD